MSFDFTLRRRLYKIFFRSVFRLLKLLAQLLKGYIKKVALGTESPYDVWQKSLDKIEIKCVLELKGQDPIQLGYIKMDVLAPCDVMREYIQRNFREQLNGIIGDSFLFFVVNKETNMELVLEREKEEVTYSKDFLYEQTDKKTMITSLVVTLVSDPEVPPIMIPEFRNEDEENDDVVAIDSI